MAYTYNDFVTAATSAGMLNQFSDDDLKITQTNPEYGLSLLSLKQNYANAQTDEQRLLASEAEKQLRTNYTAVQNSGGTLDYTSPYSQQISDAMSKITDYTSPYSQQIGDLNSQINNYGDFEYSGNTAYKDLLASIAGKNGMEYDHTKDPQWSAVKKMYLREGDRAIQDTLAKASVATGGRPSSYAVTAAALAGGNYNAQLADMIPTLYQQELQRRMNAIGALEGDRNFQYQNWQNGYNMLQNSLNNTLTLEQTDYDRLLQQLNATLAQEQTDYARYLQRYNDALATYQTLGYATPEIAEILGLDTVQNDTGANATASNTGNNYTGSYTAPAGWDEETIRAFQSAHNIDVDGIWGPQSQGAYDLDPNWVYNKDNTVFSANYDSIVEECNAFIASGAKESEISAYLRDAYNSGYISRDEWDDLRSKFVGYQY